MIFNNTVTKKDVFFRFYRKTSVIYYI